MNTPKVEFININPHQLDHNAYGHRMANNIVEVFASAPKFLQESGLPLPQLSDIERDLQTLKVDHRRTIQLISLNGEIVGFLDYKVSHPDPRGVTISLLLIKENLQGRGLGAATIKHLELQLVHHYEHISALVYGHSASAYHFWQRIGFVPKDGGGPTLEWFQKTLSLSKAS